MLLETPDNWSKKTFEFPLVFAPTIPYVGVEEARYSEGWGDMNSDEYWTYAFVWYLDEYPQILEWKLEEYMASYFDGLMKSTGVQKKLEASVVAEPTVAEFIRTHEYDQDSEYIGKIMIHDAFATNELIILNAKVRAYYCSKQQKYVVLFKFSPKETREKEWEALDIIRMNVEC